MLLYWKATWVVKLAGMMCMFGSSSSGNSWLQPPGTGSVRTKNCKIQQSIRIANLCWRGYKSLNILHYFNICHLNVIKLIQFFLNHTTNHQKISLKNQIISVNTSILVDVIFIYLLFYIVFNSQGHIATGSLQVEETSDYCTVNHRASASNYQLSNMKRLARDSNRWPQRLEARTLTATPPSPLVDVIIHNTKFMWQETFSKCWFLLCQTFFMQLI